MPTLDPGTPLHAFVNAIRQSASEVLTQTFSSPWTFEVSTEDRTSAAETVPVSFELAVSGSLQGVGAIQIQNADALLPAQRALGETNGPSEELSDDRKQAIEKLLQQLVEHAAAAMKDRFGQLQLLVKTQSTQAQMELVGTLIASEPSGGQTSIELCLTPQLQASIASAHELRRIDDSHSAVEGQGDLKDNLGRLLDVNLGLSLRFGQRSLTLREILDLGSGSVVELDRQVHEPVDLLLGEKVLARGEVLVIDGSYGIRITEVLHSC
jgi:flagellar motor switch protein FliN/FliY